MDGEKSDKTETPEYFQASLFDDSSEKVPKTLRGTKLREASFRDKAEVYVDQPVGLDLPPLVLPRRWEALAAEANKRNVPLKPIIAPVQAALIELEKDCVR